MGTFRNKKFCRVLQVLSVAGGGVGVPPVRCVWPGGMCRARVVPLLAGRASAAGGFFPPAGIQPPAAGWAADCGSSVSLALRGVPGCGTSSGFAPAPGRLFRLLRVIGGGYRHF